jgi:hypothetical protein
MTRPAPMTAETAREIVAIMRRETPKKARLRLMKTALELGNLSAAAQDVYRAELARLTA